MSAQKKVETRKAILYSEPKILVTYSREELEEINKPHGQYESGGGGCGCGGGSVLQN
jgi:hypothetical protein